MPDSDHISTPSLPQALIVPKLGHPFKIKEKCYIMQRAIPRILDMQSMQRVVFYIILNVLCNRSNYSQTHILAILYWLMFLSLDMNSYLRIPMQIIWAV